MHPEVDISVPETPRDQLDSEIAGLAGATKVLVFQLATLTDVGWQMSGEVILMTLLGGIGTMLGPVVVKGQSVDAQGRSGVAESYNADTERYSVTMPDGTKLNFKADKLRRAPSSPTAASITASASSAIVKRDDLGAADDGADTDDFCSSSSESEPEVHSDSDEQTGPGGVVLTDGQAAARRKRDREAKISFNRGMSHIKGNGRAKQSNVTCA